MSDQLAVFVDANVLIYFLDETAEPHLAVVDTLRRLLDDGAGLYTSHHVLEEVLYVVSQLSPDKKAVSEAARQVSAIPNLRLVEPATDFAFAKRYAKLYRGSRVGINDTLLLQLMLDAGITRLLSYDRAMLRQAAALDIAAVA